jgi:hypothetical protein
MSSPFSSHRTKVLAERALSLLLTASALGLYAPRASGQDEKAACTQAYEQAQVSRRNNQLKRAREELKVCAREACPAIVRSDCITWLDEVQAIYPSLAIRAVKDGSDIASVKVTEDNEVVATRLDGSSLDVEPGEHSFLFETEGAPPVNVTIVARERQKDRIVPVNFVSASHAVQAGAETTTTSYSRPTPVGVWVLAGVGVAGIATFAALGTIGTNQINALSGTCSPNCTSDQVSPIKTDYVVADIGLGVGSAALAGALIWYLLRPREMSSPGPKDALVVAPTRGGATLQLTENF